MPRNSALNSVYEARYNYSGRIPAGERFMHIDLISLFIFVLSNTKNAGKKLKMVEEMISLIDNHYAVFIYEKLERGGGGLSPLNLLHRSFTLKFCPLYDTS